MARKGIEVTIDLTKDEARELTHAIDVRLKELDGLFKSTIKLDARDAAEGVSKNIKLVRELRARIDGSETGPDEVAEK